MHSITMGYDAWKAKAVVEKKLRYQAILQCDSPKSYHLFAIEGKVVAYECDIDAATHPEAVADFEANLAAGANKLIDPFNLDSGNQNVHVREVEGNLDLTFVYLSVKPSGSTIDADGDADEWRIDRFSDRTEIIWAPECEFYYITGGRFRIIGDVAPPFPVLAVSMAPNTPYEKRFVGNKRLDPADAVFEVRAPSKKVSKRPESALLSAVKITVEHSQDAEFEVEFALYVYPK